jgi:hypothetical protein
VNENSAECKYTRRQTNQILAVAWQRNIAILIIGGGSNEDLDLIDPTPNTAVKINDLIQKLMNGFKEMHFAMKGV